MSILEKISYFDTLLSLSVVASGIKVKDDIMYDSEDNELAWEDMEYIGFENTIPYNNNHIGEFKDIYKGMLWVSMPMYVCKYIIE